MSGLSNHFKGLDPLRQEKFFCRRNKRDRESERNQTEAKDQSSEKEKSKYPEHNSRALRKVYSLWMKM